MRHKNKNKKKRVLKKEGAYALLIQVGLASAAAACFRSAARGSSRRRFPDVVESLAASRMMYSVKDEAVALPASLP